MSASVAFEIVLDLPVPATRLWQHLIDWRGHGNWIPATKVAIKTGDGGVGTTFTATTGLGPLRLVDQMTVVRLDEKLYSAEVLKTGRQIQGRAGFTVSTTADGSRLLWWEKVTMAKVPNFTSAFQAWLGKQLFKFAILRLVKQINR